MAASVGAAVAAVEAFAADPKEHKATDRPVHDYNQPTTASRMNVHPFVSVRCDIQAKPAEFLAFGLLLRDSEFRTNYSRYARVKDQRIGLPPSVETSDLCFKLSTNAAC